MNKLSFNDFKKNQIKVSFLSAVKGGSGAWTQASSGGDYRNCETGKVTFGDGSTGQGPTGGSNCDAFQGPVAGLEA